MRRRCSLGGFALLVWTLIPASAAAQDRPPPALRLGGLYPGGVRGSATETWSVIHFNLTNLTDIDRNARVVFFYAGRPDIQYARELMVPARTALQSWLLAGDGGKRPGASHDVQALLYDLTDGRETLMLPPTEEKVRSRGILYRNREPTTAILLDDTAPQFAPGQLPQPDTPDEEALTLVRTLRHARGLSHLVSNIAVGHLPVVPEPFAGIDHFVLASDRIVHESGGLVALRHWIEHGGRAWIMLDRVSRDTVAALLGDALDFQIVDRVGLTTTTIESGALSRDPSTTQHHELPVDLVRVLLPAGAEAAEYVNGWPAWFARPFGRGEVFFTTLGPRGWHRPRTRSDPKSPFIDFPQLPVPGTPLVQLADRLHPGGVAAPDVLRAFEPMLAEQIGYAVLSRGQMIGIFAAFLALACAAALVLRKLGRADLRGWLGPVAALAAMATFFFLAEASRRAADPTVAVGQIVTAAPGKEEAAIHGLLAVYRPVSGPIELGATQGGIFELDMAGIEGKPRRFVLTDVGAWRWDDLELPAGIRLAPFKFTRRLPQPLAATARFGPDGVVGKLQAGDFAPLGDPILTALNGRHLAVRLRADGVFTASSDDALATGQFVTGAVLTDEQRHRQAISRAFLREPTSGSHARESGLLAWGDPTELNFTLPAGARVTGTALLAVPVAWQRPAPGESVTIPGAFVAMRRLIEGRRTRPAWESHQGSVQELRFQAPASVLPFQVSKARLTAKIDAPARSVAVAAGAAKNRTELHRVDNPLVPIRVEIVDPALLQLDADGGLTIQVAIGNGASGKKGTPDEPSALEKWTIEYIELELIGQAAP